MKKHRRKMFAIVLAVLLAAAMVLPLFLTAVYAADRSPDEKGETVSATSGSSKPASAGGTDVKSASAAAGGSSTETVSGAGGKTSVLTCIDGIYIENIDVSGMTKDEVQNAIDQKISDLSLDPVTLYAGDRSAVVTAGDLGLYCPDENLAEEAVNIGRRGNIVKRFLADQYVRRNGRIVLPLKLSVSENRVTDALNRSLTSLNSDPKAASIEIQSDGTLEKKDKTDGIQVDVAKSAVRVTEYMDNEWNGGAGGVRVTYKVIPASQNEADLEGITDQLGSYTTQFDPSNTGRVTNIRRAAELIDGTIIQPGAEFDFSNDEGKTTAENGFELAGSYENGNVVDTYGGGICQASTTLYNAVLRAELDITERHPHSITVNYVDPSLDAAIADGSKNFRFRNSTDHAIYIYAKTGKDSVTFAVLGKETRDASRKLKFESRTVSTTPYTTAVKLDSSRNYGVIESSGGHDGLEAQAWKSVYVNGVKQSEEQVNDSEYSMSPLTYLVGIKGAGESQLSALQKAASNNDIATIRALVW